MMFSFFCSVVTGIGEISIQADVVKIILVSD